VSTKKRDAFYGECGKEVLCANTASNVAGMTDR
jgi:hypothetical protein